MSDDAATQTTQPTVPPAGLQRVVQVLSSYWAGLGCALLPPCNLEIGDAFLHPKTFFGLLGQEPWQGVTAQPVSRPRDGRRGVHPFRTSIHLQLQAALERERPAEVRDQVIDCLVALGLDLRRRHLRLDSRQWRHDAVGARGRGWRLSVDGIAIGRITFLDRLADVSLDGRRAARVDVTLGVEHLAMVLAGVDSVYRLPWQGDGDDALRYDQLRRTDEEEQSRYVEQVADVEHLRGRLHGLEQEAARCLDAGLVRPAYERAVECLAVLDVLAMRGELGEGERQRWTQSVRGLVARVGELHLARTTPAKPVDESQPAAPAAAEKPTEATRDETPIVTPKSVETPKPEAPKRAPRKPAGSAGKPAAKAPGDGKKSTKKPAKRPRKKRKPKTGGSSGDA